MDSIQKKNATFQLKQVIEKDTPTIYSNHVNVMTTDNEVIFTFFTVIPTLDNFQKNKQTIETRASAQIIMPLAVAGSVGNLILQQLEGRGVIEVDEQEREVE